MASIMPQHSAAYGSPCSDISSVYMCFDHLIHGSVNHSKSYGAPACQSSCFTGAMTKVYRRIPLIEALYGACKPAQWGGT